MCIRDSPCLVIAINEHVEINGISVLPVPLKDRKGEVKNNGDVQEEGTPWGEDVYKRQVFIGQLIAGETDGLIAFEKENSLYSLLAVSYTHLDGFGSCFISVEDLKERFLPGKC